ncbi:MAG: S1 RNA-binding domain-containing protein [Oscillospiraceae bacterium]|nr:S1 RNA-binding domain-containing protein [Oscillospiraceae bacterium]MBQ5314420.1 S1 RNA-binding domain-containing protein [Oscillospiraceae bacterium]
MQVEIGKIYEGKVTGITKFGAFVEIEQGVTGMVHISEVANTYVNEIKDHVTEGQVVKVKVISIGDDNKISLSIKKALPPVQKPQQSGNRPNKDGGFAPRKPKPAAKQQSGDKNRIPEIWEPKKPVTAAEQSFEDMLNKFKQNSEEKQCDLKRSIDGKRKSGRRGSK